MWEGGSKSVIKSFTALNLWVEACMWTIPYNIKSSCTRFAETRIHTPTLDEGSKGFIGAKSVGDLKEGTMTEKQALHWA